MVETLTKRWHLHTILCYAVT